MIEPELKQQLDALSAKMDAIYASAEKTRKYIYWTIIATVVVVVLPLLFLPFAVNTLLSSYSSVLGM